MAVITIKLIPDSLFRDAFNANIRFGQNLVEFAKINLSKYESSAPIAIMEDGEDAAEYAFDLTNNPSRQIDRERLYGPRRSVSVGDVVEVTNFDGSSKQYLCDAVGWKEL